MVKPLLGLGHIANRVPVAVYALENDAHDHAIEIGGYVEEVPFSMPNSVIHPYCVA
jgi:hypothetical protein